jgi:hypothetical protein
MTTGQKIAVAVMLGVVLMVALLGVAAFVVVPRIATAFATSFKTAGVDNQFGDQWLKSAVAQLELHRLRYGKYPKTLHELKYLSPMDTSILYNVAYYPNADLTAYYVEVETGFLGKPTLEYPDEFWQGTGFRKDLKPVEKTIDHAPKSNPPLQPPRHKAAGG